MRARCGRLVIAGLKYFGRCGKAEPSTILSCTCATRSNMAPGCFRSIMMGQSNLQEKTTPRRHPNHPAQKRPTAFRKKSHSPSARNAERRSREKRNKCRRPSEASYAGFTLDRSGSVLPGSTTKITQNYCEQVPRNLHLQTRELLYGA